MYPQPSCSTVFPGYGDVWRLALAALTDPKPARLSQEVLVTTVGALGANAGAILRLEGDRLWVVSGMGLSPGVISRLNGLQVSSSQDAAAQSVVLRRVLAIDDLRLHPFGKALGEEAMLQGLRSVLAVPLFGQGVLWGVLEVFSVERCFFKEEHLHKLAPLAELAGSGLVLGEKVLGLENKSDTLNFILNLSLKLGDVMDVNQFLSEFASEVSSIFASDCVLLTLRGPDGLKKGAWIGVGRDDEEVILARMEEIFPSSLGDFFVREGLPDYWQRQAVGKVLGARLKYLGNDLGFLLVGLSKDRNVQSSDQEVIRALANQAAASLQNRRLLERTKELASVDALTGLLNRRSLEMKLWEVGGDFARFGTPASFVMCDIDHFKKFNDTHGHEVGDKVLRMVAETIKGSIRDSDGAYRYGGEELCVLLPKTRKETALAVAHRIHGAVRSLDFPEAKTQPLGHLSVSVGVATLGDKVQSVEEMVKKADEALYEAKKDGRDQVRVFE